MKLTRRLALLLQINKQADRIDEWMIGHMDEKESSAQNGTSSLYGIKYAFWTSPPAQLETHNLAMA